MFVKLLLVAVLLGVLQPREVNSTEFLKNAFNNVKLKVKEIAHQVHNIFEPNHKHPETEMTTKLPLIDIRYGKNNGNEIGEDDGIVFPNEDGSVSVNQGGGGNIQASSTSDYRQASSTSGYNKELDVDGSETTDNPDLASRSIIGAPCGNGMRLVDGNCRRILG